MQDRLADTKGIVSVPPSQHFEGADGSWSSFEIQVGTPGQSVRLLPGTSASAADSVWVVIDPGCSVLNTAISDCASKRGGLFNSNTSTTWSKERLTNDGLFSMVLIAEQHLNLLGNDNAYYGFDTVQLGPAGSTVLSNQLVGGMATNDFYLGVLGLSPIPSNFTSFNTPVPSLLGSMRNQSIVNSTSWAYTAGKAYANPPVFGSLTFGGYDASRASGNSIQVPLYQDISTDLLVGLQSITYDSYGSSPLLSTGIYIFLDSLVAQMWLPLVVCDQFEKQFNLTWNDNLQYYFVSEAAHKSLEAQNPAFTFTIGASAETGSNSTQIKIPYAAFNLNLTAPYVNNTDRYFPLRRAANSSQYTLGRVFFQEAYVVADYDKGVFNVSQAQSINTNTSTQLVSLNPALAPTSSSSPSSSHSSALSVGAIVGIVIGVVALLTLVTGLVIWLFRRRKGRRTPAELGANGDKYMFQNGSPEPKELSGASMDVSKVGKYELDPRAIAVHEMRVEDAELYEGSKMSHAHEVPAAEKRLELHGGPNKLYAHEMPTVERRTELPNKQSHRWELPT